ncbi:unnamed protein product [Arctogadus glacialis]
MWWLRALRLGEEALGQTQLCSASGSCFFASSKEGAWISKGPLCAWRESTCSLCRRDGLEELYTQVPEVLGKALDEQ